MKQNFYLDAWRTLSKNWLIQMSTYCNKILKTSLIFNVFISWWLVKVSESSLFALAGAGAGCDGHPDCGGKELHNFLRHEPKHAR